MQFIGREACPCGRCDRWFLTGIGQFVQGSFFTLDEADEIVAAVNTFRAGAAQVPELAESMDALNGQSPDQEPDAPAADQFTELHLRVANIIRKAYFALTRNPQKAHDTALDVLQEVQRTYERLAEEASDAPHKPN